MTDAPAGDRPTRTLSPTELLRLSGYWLGLVAVFVGIGVVLQERIKELVPDPTIQYTTLGVVQAAGVVIAVIVQPTVGTISDYTISRFGRRKPYILIGTLFDVVFLIGLATSNTILAVAAFVILLQFSSNFAQGPFQGYVPDLVPAQQVGIASGLVGLFNILGIMVGTFVATIGLVLGDFTIPTIALGLIELVTMLSLFFRLDEGRRARDRNGRRWRSIAGEAWGTDILQERSFLYLHTPIITGSDAEGAGAMFQVTTLDLMNLPRAQAGAVDFHKDFFEKPAFLTVSGQLEAEIFALAFANVYTFGPTFRAENSNTPRHLAEFWMVEPEMAFCDLDGNRKLAEAFLKAIIADVLDRCRPDLEFFNKRIDDTVLATLEHVVESDFAHVPYTEAIQILEKAQSAGRQWEFPVHWGGDSTATFESMAETLRGGLSLGLGGFGFWSHDIGGFEQNSNADVYKRWTAFGLLSSHSRLHGSSSYRVPWNYDDEAVAVLSKFTKLKCSLMPYLFRAAIQAHEDGIPMLRAMMLEFPNDPACNYLDLQYMLGDSLLVAPVFRRDGRVSYYVPHGKWTNLLDGNVIEGPCWVQETHDFLSLPLLVRPNSVIPVGNRTDKPNYDYCDGVTLHICQLNEGKQVSVEIPDLNGKTETTFSLKRERTMIYVQRQGASKQWNVYLAGIDSVKTVERTQIEIVNGSARIKIDREKNSLEIQLK